MDVLLLAATASLTTYLPRHFIHSESTLSSAGQRLFVTLSLGLSLTLFSLSLIELVPGSWLLWLREVPNEASGSGSASNHHHHHHGGNYWTIAGAYRVILWTMAVLCTVLIPSAAGTQIFLARTTTGVDHKDHDEQKKRAFTVNKKRHWSVRIPDKCFSVLLKAAYFVLATIFRRIRSCCSQRKEKAQLPTLSTERGDEKRSFLGCSASRSLLFRFPRDPAFRRSAILGSFSGTALACSVLMCISPIVVEPSSNFSTRLLLRLVSWLCAVGILLSTVLNGFGSISLPYSCLAGLFLEPIPPDSVANAEIELEKAKATLEWKRKELESGRIPLPLGSSQSKKSIWRKVRSDFSDLGDEVNQRKKIMLTEIEFLETLIDEMSEDVEEMRHSQTISAKARSSAGRIRSWIGVAFSVLLLVRLFWAMSNVWNQYTLGVTLHRTSGVDPVTRILVWLSGHHVVNEGDLHTLSQFISLLLTAFLSFSQVRTFLQTARTVQRRLSNFYRRCYCKPRCRSSKADASPSSASGLSNSKHAWFFSLLVSALMCCYCLACIVLTKMMLPFEYRSSFSNALNVSAEENALFTIRSFAVDVAFSATAVLSGAVLAMILGIMRSNARRYGAIDNASLIKKSPSMLVTPTLAEP